MQSFLSCRDRILDLRIPQVMGILNVTPDSFSDGGWFYDREVALAQARRLVEEGVAIIDVGGESTRPGAAEISTDEELERVIPVIERIAAELPVIISVDTSRPEVMRSAVAAGAGFINDVRALRSEGALATAAQLNVPVCLMHMQGEPRTMQAAPHYDDVVSEVCTFLADRMKACCEAGMSREQLVIDPGFGFGKTLAHNLRLLRNLDRFGRLDVPLLVGLSRKSMVGALLNVTVDQRLHGSVAAATLACWNGAHIIRAHDVLATVQAVHLCQAVKEESD
jgi:dihydropteroate synthase